MDERNPFLLWNPGEPSEVDDLAFSLFASALDEEDDED